MRVRLSEFEYARGIKLCAKYPSEIRRASPSAFEITQDLRPDVPLVTARAMTGTGHIAEMLIDLSASCLALEPRVLLMISRRRHRDDGVRRGVRFENGEGGAIFFSRSTPPKPVEVANNSHPQNNLQAWDRKAFQG